jgi:hypothetical protein
MDNLVISKIGQYIVIRDVYLVTIYTCYPYEVIETKIFQFFSELYEWLIEYIYTVKMFQAKIENKIYYGHQCWEKFYPDIERINNQYDQLPYGKLYDLQIESSDFFGDEKITIQISKIKLSDRNKQ